MKKRKTQTEDKKELEFPYQRYNAGQANMLNTMRRAIKEKRNLFIQASTGSGKTIIALKAALDSGRRMFYFPPHTQEFRPVFTEIEALARKNKVTAVGLIGKHKMCINQLMKEKLEKDEIDKSEFSTICSTNRKNCPYNNMEELVKFLKRPVVNPLDVVDECKTSCPYYICDELMRIGRDITVVDYNHIVIPPLLKINEEKKNWDLQNKVVVFDEGHQLSQRIQDAYSAELKQKTIERAIKEAREEGSKPAEKVLKYLLDCFTSLEEKLRENSTNEVELTKNDFPCLSRDELTKLKTVRDRRYKKMKKSYCNAVLNFERLWFLEDIIFKSGELKEDPSVRSVKKDEDDQKHLILSVKLLTEQVFASSLIRNKAMPSSIILMSGSMRPMNYFSKPLNFGREEYLDIGYPFSEHNRLIVLDTSTSSKDVNRNKHLWKHLAHRITAYANAINGNIMVVFPSYQYKLDFLEYARRYTVFKDMRRKQIEERQKDSKQQVSEKYAEVLKTDNAILLAVARGHFAEGLDYDRGRKLSAAIICGAPYPHISLFTERKKRYYSNMFKNNFLGGLFSITYPMIVATIQAAGRAVRTREDRGIIILMDSRYAQKTNYTYINKYFPDLKIEHDENRITNQIKEFQNAVSLGK